MLIDTKKFIGDLLVIGIGMVIGKVSKKRTGMLVGLYRH